MFIECLVCAQELGSGAAQNECDSAPALKELIVQEERLVYEIMKAHREDILW